MNKKIIGIGLLSLAIGFYACKKEELQNPSKTSGDVTNSINNEKRISGTFDPDNWNDEEVEIEVTDFIAEKEAGSLVDLSVDQLEWYVEAGVNYRNANYVEFTDSKSETLTFNVNVGTSAVTGNDVSTLFDGMETAISNYVSSLPSEFQNILFIDVEADNTVSSGTLTVTARVVCSHSTVAVVNLTEAGAVTNFDHWYVGSSYISWYLPFDNMSEINPFCGSTYKAHGANDFMLNSANSMISTNNYGGIIGGSGINSWVTAPVCNGAIGQIKWIHDINGYDMESNSNFVLNRDPQMASTYPYEVLTKNSAGATSGWNLSNGCVDFTQIKYYADKSIHRAKSSAVYSWLSINTNKNVVQMAFKRTAYKNVTLVWQVPHATYGRCQMKSTPN